MTPAWGDLLEALKTNEGSLEEFVAGRRNTGLQDTLRHCAVVRSFDQALFDAELTTGVQDAPTFAELVASPSVEPVPRQDGVHRVTAGGRADLWRGWWPGDPPVAPNELPGDLRDLLERLVPHFTGLELLEVNACLNADEAAKQFGDLYAEADRAFDLPGCQDLIDILAAPERALVIDARLHQLRAERQAYLRARSHWSAEHYRTAQYLPPDGVQALYEGLLARDAKTRAIHLHAPGGRGKSMQLQWLIARRLVPDASLGAWAGGRVLCAKVDFDLIDAVQATTHPWLVLLELAAQLNDELPNQPFTSFLEEVGWALPLLSTAAPEAEREAAAQKLTTPSNQVAGVPQRFTSILRSVTGERPVVLLFDTLEEVHLRPDGDLRALLGMFGKLMEDAKNVRLILAGRYPVSQILGDVAKLLPDFAEHQVKPFTRAQAGHYLETIRGLPDTGVRKAIVAKAGGDPFLLALLADAAQSNPEITPEEITNHPADLVYLIRRVVTRVREPGVRWLLRYGVVPRILTLSFVREVMQRYVRAAMAGTSTLDTPAQDEYEFAEAGVEPQAVFRTDLLSTPDDTLDLERLWADLRRYAGSTSWVSPVTGGALRFRAEVVNPMRRVIGEHPVYKCLHRDAITYYEEKAAHDPSHWADWTRAAIYHRFQVDGPEAGDHWRAALREAGGNPERRAAIAGEILGREYLDERGGSLPWTDARPLLSDAILLDARAELGVALTERARRRGISASDPVWSDVETAFARLEPLFRDRAPADPRLAFIRGALELRREQRREAADTASAALATDPPAVDRVRLEVLLADANLLLGDRAAAADGYRRALAAGAQLATPPDWLPSIRRNAMAVAADVDALDAALDEYERARAAVNDDEERAELDVIAAGIQLRCGSVSEADRLAARAQTAGIAGAAGVRVRAASVRYEPRTASELALHQARTDTNAEAIELAGETSAALLDYDPAVEALETARREADAEGDLEAVVRCSNTLAAFELREIGDLNAARHHLDEAERVNLPQLAAPRLRAQLLRAELEDRVGNRDEASRLLRAHMQMLGESKPPPRRFVAAALATLGHAHPEQHPAALDVLAAQVREISPASARAVALAGLRGVPALPHLAADPRLLAVREALGSPEQWQLADPDRAILSLILADLDRVLGDREMTRRVENAAHGLAESPSSFWLRAVTQATGALPLPSLDDPQRFETEFADYPLLCGAFMIERAEAEWRGGKAPARSLEAASHHLSRASGKPTQWHLRLLRLTDPDSTFARRLARQLGLPLRAVDPPDSSEAAFAELRRRRAAVRLYESPGADIEATWPQGAGSAPGPPSYFAERVKDAWSRDPIRAAELLAQTIGPPELPDAEIRLQIESRALQPLPWELAFSHSSVVVRTSGDREAEQDEVAFLQAALAEAVGVELEIDGRLGQRTEAALRDFQQRLGVPADGVLRDDVLAQLQAGVAVGPRSVILLQASAEQQLYASRGNYNSGADLTRQYDYAGFRVHLIEQPTVSRVRTAVAELQPAVLHLSAGLRETSAGIESTFQAGDWSALSKRDPQGADGFTVTAVDSILEAVPTPVRRPLVILDAENPYSAPEVLSQLMLRNDFAGSLFALGHCPAVLATGFVGGAAYELYSELTGGLGGHRSIVEITRALQSQHARDLNEPGGSATALFTNLPWLRTSLR